MGPSLRKAADVLAVGDVVHVVTDRRGAAQLSQLPAAQSALVAIDPVDGGIVSMVGGFDFYSNKFNRVTQARRQPGSGFKPFFYSAALEEGFTPASVILDMPIMLEGRDSEENWRPKNYGGEFGGPMRLREALVGSRNLVSIRILQDIGVDAAINHAAKFGFDPKSLPHNFTLALGTQSVTPLEMVTGFAIVRQRWLQGRTLLHQPASRMRPARWCSRRSRCSRASNARPRRLRHPLRRRCRRLPR